MDRNLEVAWAAGFIDGEGSICIGKHSKKSGEYYFLQFHASQQCPEPLIKLKGLFGGSVAERNYKGRNRYWEWHSSNRIAGKALVELYPYLIVKKQEAEVAISFQERRKHGGGISNPYHLDSDRKDRQDLIDIKRNRKYMH